MLCRQRWSQSQRNRAGGGAGNILNQVLLGMWTMVRGLFVPLARIMKVAADGACQATRQLLIRAMFDSQLTLLSDLRLKCGSPEGNSRV
ncbi:hypothetical protein BCCGELA001_31035 [Bradyrhizobium sp. CCGE-LA001]|nr:hypothetical protein BCCGELA001_31035 [Bradyrhizobium sp. CCGE-LA001]